MFKALFGSKPKDASSPQPGDEMPAPGGIRYDPNLISNLKADHKKLLNRFQQIGAFTARRDAEALVEELHGFGHDLNDHLIRENVRFYVYLKNSLGSEGLATAQSFAREMQQIGRSVTDFLHRYTSMEHWEDWHWPTFETELGEIGKVLTQRIEAEENSLYALYQAPAENQ